MYILSVKNIIFNEYLHHLGLDDQQATIHNKRNLYVRNTDMMT
jgi:hypothetical protein